MYKVLLLLATVAIRHGSASSEKPLYFSLMVSSAASMNTTGVVDAVNDALEAINNSSTLLPSNKLLYTNGRPLDTQVCLLVYTVFVRTYDWYPTTLNAHTELWTSKDSLIAGDACFVLETNAVGHRRRTRLALETNAN